MSRFQKTINIPTQTNDDQTKSKFKQAVNQKLTDEEIANYQNRLDTLRSYRNTITEHEFEAFIPLFQKKITLSEEQINSLRETLSLRFDLFSNIKVVNAAGEIVVEFPAILRSPDTLNDSPESHIQNYATATILTDPLHNYEKPAADELAQAIMHFANRDSIRKYLENRRQLTEKYFTPKSEKSDDSPITQSFKINTDEMF